MAEASDIFPKVKKCTWCKAEKPREEFHKDKSQFDGLGKRCKPCAHEYYKMRMTEYKEKIRLRINEKDRDLRRRTKKIMAEDLLLERQSDEIKRIVEYFILSPKSTVEEVATVLGLSYARVQKLCATNTYLRALRTLAARRVSSFVPLAVEGLRKSLDANSEEVKLKAVVKVLENENILGPTKVDMTINDLSKRPIEELQKIVEDAKTLPSPTIEAELVQ